MRISLSVINAGAAENAGLYRPLVDKISNASDAPLGTRV